MESNVLESQLKGESGAGCRVILLVEDNLDDILLTRRACKKACLPVYLQVVEDGDAAVAYLAGTGKYGDRMAYPVPDLILLDLKLPKRSGLEVLGWVRAQSCFAAIPIIVLTSSVEEEDILKAYQEGANSYLQKPVAFLGLVQRLSALGQYWLDNNVTPHSLHKN